ncbi:MAG: ATP-dependent zinc metalloprotease FtsH [Candidatus Eisenbacteria bacterium]|nr:ATP-dependent zinc metalloprotease FtsH [Candidatus Latescibacterota bacterium]MBD3301918.1 ATP-dependent zinc metalloprotease FtsH [Candidatus Eisenbacteria bacterium]
MGGRQFRTFTFWILFVLAVVWFVQHLVPRTSDKEISYTEFLEQVEAKNLQSVTFVENEVHGTLRNPLPTDPSTNREAIQEFTVRLPAEDPDLPKMIRETDPNVTIRAREAPTPWTNYLFSPLIMIAVLALFWLLFLRQMQSGGSAALKFGKSRAKILSENTVKVTFRDVAGADEAKEELQEVIEFLRDPKKFQKLGGRIPKGALLLGPPGTGKTLLAKAVAGEAGVPFFSMSGSDFVEMFVGVGASRVRDLFDQGKRNAPCIIFIDEIDAVGRQRGAGMGGGHDEREQTLNQLLVEMDGFESNEGVILLAATNRPDVLDPALLRPGRFDRQIVVDRPDVRGREGILKVHMKNKPVGDDVDIRSLARGTPGMAGADLANMVNEAALLAARRNRRKIAMQDFEEAKDKVMMGAERKSLVLSDQEKRTTAYHEAGHALVGWLVPEADPIHKVTVIPRGRALGVTHFLPEGDHYTRTREYFLATMTTMMGGRAAEELIFGRITNGAASDIQGATNLARKMVCEWGMSERLGPLQFGKKQDLIFLGREIQEQKDYSERTAEAIDDEVHKLVQGSYDRARRLLTDNIDSLHALAAALLEQEILDRMEIERVLKGGSLREPPDDGTEGGAEAEGRTGEPEPKRRGDDPDVGPLPDPTPGPATP